MTLNNTPSSERVHIGIFGRRNAGKSSLINALTGQSLAIVSDVKGTTTDPVLKAMELLPLGPVVMIDTPGLDDTGTLGAMRVQKAYQILNKTDIALLVLDASIGMTNEDRAILSRIKEKAIPYLLAWNKSDLLTDEQTSATQLKGLLKELHIPDDHSILVSADRGHNMDVLKERIAAFAPAENDSRRIVSDLIHPGELIILVVPIDKAAPKGRLILPQQQTIRDILDTGAAAIVTRDSEFADTLKKLSEPPALVITDSQVFGRISKLTPPEIPLTSFSILFARYKGNLDTVVTGARALDDLQDGDTILLCEGCTHHRQCEDIGTVKLPKWIQEYTGKTLDFAFTSGTEFPLELEQYKMIIHCGGCTLNEREMRYRLKCAEDAKIPITNYGTAIAYMKGILERSIEIFQ